MYDYIDHGPYTLSVIKHLKAKLLWDGVPGRKSYLWSNLCQIRSPWSEKGWELLLLQTQINLVSPWDTRISLEIIAQFLKYSLWWNRWGQTVDTVLGSWSNVTTNYRLSAVLYKQWWQEMVSGSYVMSVCVCWVMAQSVRDLGFRALDSVNKLFAVFHTWLQTASISMCGYVKEMKQGQDKKRKDHTGNWHFSKRH